MKVEIANPIYEVVFKYMMEDKAVAKILVSSIIGEDIISLEPKPQEYIVEKTTTEGSTLTVYRLDFSAKIKTPDGHKLVIIEMQKASFPADIMRFRNHQERNLTAYTIYLLDDALGSCNTPVLKISSRLIDMETQEVIEGKCDFFESLYPPIWIVDFSCIQKPHRNELELLLSVFDQNNRTTDHHILNVCEEDFPEKYRPLIRRLKQAAVTPEVKEQMRNEDEAMRLKLQQAGLL